MIFCNYGTTFKSHERFTFGMNILFICNQNKHRSKTAEEIFRKRFETRSAGLFNGKPVTRETIAWADIICVMEEEQRIELAKRFPKEYLKKRILSLDIPDTYSYGQPELIMLLEKKVENFIELYLYEQYETFSRAKKSVTSPQSTVPSKV